MKLLLCTVVMLSHATRDVLSFTPLVLPANVYGHGKTHRSYREDKPTTPVVVEMEEATDAIVTPTTEVVEAKHACASIQGLTSKRPGECCNYACNMTDKKLEAELERLVQPRAYPLFLMEKATKILGDTMNPVTKMPMANVEAPPAIQKTKEKLVILGAGWGAAALLQDIDNDLYDVTVISPRNFFLFTPMLAGASVGTVDVRSITQPIREFNRQANYLEASATSVDTQKEVITCEGVQCDEECILTDFDVPYDRLVVAVGAKTNTFGIPGVTENCLFLKQIGDARKIRRKVVNLFERANWPNTPEATIRKLLTFVVIGAGPTGIEFAAELRDFLEEDGPKYYPSLLKFVQIKVIEASPDILRPFDEKLRDAAVEALTRKVVSKEHPTDASSLFPEELIELLMNRRVQEVTEDSIKMDNGGTELPYGLAVWAGGIGPLDITLNIIKDIGGRQAMAQEVARGKIAVDPWMRAIDGDGRVFAMGDCACTQGQCLPSTAQVAAQEGEFLAHLLSTANLTTTPAYSEEGILLPPLRDLTKSKLEDKVTAVATKNNKYVAPFQFLDMGIMAYTGGSSALAQVQVTPNNEKARVKAKGNFGYGLWQGVYLMKQASPRNRVLVLLDWAKARCFGRDITTID